ncbi:MAG: Fur family transcriptional regulator [Candidatus Dojkabacteria bacterium]
MQEVLELIKTKKFRLTKPRKQIIEYIWGSDQPVSPVQIASSLRASVDKATVYRTLEFLVDLKLIESNVYEDKIVRYEKTIDKHHHHLVCKNCGSIEHIASKRLEKHLKLRQLALSKRHSFTVTDHVLEFYGKCRNCK